MNKLFISSFICFGAGLLWLLFLDTHHSKKELVLISSAPDLSAQKEFTESKKYFVSPHGNDHHDGLTSKTALRTINAAVQKMIAGDTCYLHQGVYRESVTITKDYLTFVNVSNERVTVTGLDLVSQWTHFKSNIFQAPFSPEEKNNTPTNPAHLNAAGSYSIQVFANQSLMPQAQYPNRTGELLQWEKRGGNVKIYTDGQLEFMDSKEIWPENHWEGGVFHAIVERKFNAVQGVLGSNRPGRALFCQQTTSDWSKSNNKNFVKNLFSEIDDYVTGVGKGFITNHLNALDTIGEWYYDKSEEILYFKPPNPEDIKTMQIEARSRKYAFIIKDAHHTTIKGLHLKAAGIDIQQGSNTSILYCKITYPMPFYIHKDEYNGRSLINIRGDKNQIRDCYIAHAWGTGILIHKGNSNVIANCVIEDVNWMGNYNACIRSGGHQTQLIHNTLRESGRFLIEAVGMTQGRIAYNHMYNGMRIGQDGGGFYTYISDGQETEIAFNWVHDIVGIPWERSTLTNDHNLTVGIYLDGGCQNYHVHHNLVWNVKYGIVLNANTGKVAQGNQINYNTLVTSDVAILSKNLPNVYRNNSAKFNLGNRKVAALVDKSNNQMEENGVLEKMTRDWGKGNKTSRLAKSHAKVGAYEEAVKPWIAGADTTAIPNW